MTEPGEVVNMIASHSITRGGKLEMVFINGCKSEAFGRALHASGIPFVLCWKTLAADNAARVAITAFFEVASTGSSYEAAFDAARQALVFETCARTGPPAQVASQVPKFCIADPENNIPAARPHPIPDCTPRPIATGLWLLLTPTGEVSW